MSETDDQELTTCPVCYAQVLRVHELSHEVWHEFWQDRIRALIENEES